MNNLEIFKNSNFGEVRTIVENDEILFCAIDVARALGYKNTRDAIQKHCKRGVSRNTTHPQSPDKTIEMIFIPESDVYRLIIKSKLPQAEEFEIWVFEEVIPSIRKHGGYLTPQAIEEALVNPDTLIQLATILKEEKEKNETLTLVNKQQEQIINELQPKATYYDLILQCKDLLSITQIAKDYGRGGAWLNKTLNQLGIQYKLRDTWLLYSKYADKGYTGSKTQNYVDKEGYTHSKMYTYWTQKGRLFIYEKLKKQGILPLIEIN